MFIIISTHAGNGKTNVINDLLRSEKQDKILIASEKKSFEDFRGCVKVFNTNESILNLVNTAIDKGFRNIYIDDWNMFKVDMIFDIVTNCNHREVLFKELEILTKINNVNIYITDQLARNQFN